MLGAGVALALGASLVVVSAEARSADAGIFNPIPMNSAEEPNDLFTDADALFAFVTSDLKGGTICIVSADVQTPDGGSCDRPAWGSPNFIVGIGSVIQPIQPPPLKPGNWKLLTENTDGTGTGLSDVFTVEPCPTCSRRIADAALAPWKAMAASRGVGAGLYCRIQELRDRVEAAREEALGTEKLEWKDTGVVLLTFSYTPGGGFALELADPLVVLQQKALEILKDLTCALENMYGNIAADPPRFDYQSVPPTLVGTVSPMPSPEETQLAEAFAAQVAHGSASLRAYERYLGAVANGDTAGVIRQAQAASDESVAFIDSIIASAAALEAFADYADTEPALAGPLFADQATLDELASGYTRVRTSGFTAAELAQLHALGLSDLQISGLRDNLALDVTGVPAAATVGGAARQLAADLRSSVPAIDAFATEAAAVAARNQLDVANQPPVASFVVSTAEGEQPLFTFFNANGSTDADGFLVDFQWDFGDGSTTQGSFASHTYPDPGTYTVTLTVTDDAGATSQSTQVITVHPTTVPPDLVPPVGRRVSPGLPYPFTAVGSTAATDKLLTFTFDFGDGSLPTSIDSTDSATVTHTYGSPGTYVLTTTATNALGISTTAQTEMVVGSPVADAGPDLLAVEGMPITLSGPTASRPDVNTTVLWSFGDGEGSDLDTPQHTYRDDGVYVVTRTVQDAVSLEVVTDTASVVVSNAPPTVKGVAYIATPAAGAAASFRSFASDPGASDVLTTTWSFGDGSTAAGAAVDHVFTADGTYSVTATVTDDAGASSSSSRTVRVGPATGSADSKGTEHWLAFQTNAVGDVPQLTLSISAEVATSGEVEVPAIGFREPFTVTPGAVTPVTIPAEAMPIASPDVQSLALHVVAADEVTVYGLNRIKFTTDAFLGLPRDVLGSSHVVASFTGALPSEITVAAPFNDTVVDIQPVGELTFGPTTPTSFVLDAGDVVQLQGVDLTGSVVTSSRPVAVFGGNQCGNVPLNMTFCDHLTEQMPATDLLGSRFVTVPLATRLGGDTVRVVATQPATAVTINGTVVTTLGQGEYYETLLAVPSLITTSAPAVVAQYSNGSSFDQVVSDPFEMLVPPTEQYLASYTVSTPATGFATNFLNLVAPAAATAAVQVDGVSVDQALWVPVAGTQFSGAQVPVALGSHTVSSATPVGVFVYGFDEFDSYGYPGGFQLAKVAAVASVSVTPATQSLLVGSTACAVATVIDDAGLPVADVRVDFAVSGVHPSTAFAFTNPLGVAQRCWTGSAPGTDSVVASVGADSAVATVEWTTDVVVNGPPVADAKFVVTVEDLATSVTLSGSDPDGDPLTFEVVTPPSHGTLTGSGATLTYTPAPNFFGHDSFTYRASDGVSVSDAVVSIEVAAANDRPTAADAAVVTEEDVATPITLIGADVEGSPLTFTVVEPPLHGTLTGNGAARTYTPNRDFNGNDSFTYRVSDGQLDSALATVNITVTPVNDAPIVVDRVLTTPQGTAVSIGLSGVDVDDDLLSFEVLSDPLHGILTGADASMTYTPDPDFFGVEAFTYRASDGLAFSNLATVSITVERVNRAPVADDHLLTTAEDNPLQVLLSGSDPDSDPLTFDVVVSPKHGSLTGVGAQRTYTPSPDFFGVDSFTYTVSDGSTTSQAATVTVTVTPVNDAPVVSVTAGTPRVEGGVISLSASVSDVDGDALTTSWTVTATALDAGASCTMGASTVTSSSVVCTDDGPVTVTALVDDGTVASPASVDVFVLNAAPLATIRPAVVAGVAPSTVTISADVTDAGSNDSQSCTIAFGDGSSQLVPVVVGSCSASTTIVTAGPYTATVTVTDDDGGQSVTSRLYDVAAPPPPAACSVALGDGYWTSSTGTWKLELEDDRAPFDAVADTLEITRPGVRQREYLVASVNLSENVATIVSKPAKDGSRLSVVVVDNGKKGDRFSAVITASDGSVIASTDGLRTVTKDDFKIGPRAASTTGSCLVPRPRS